MVRVRIAPSPTGLFHIGTARTALYNYLFARHNKGVFIYRVEDTDKERSTKEYEENITSGMFKMGLPPDEGIGLKKEGEFGPYRQSERTDLYRKYLKELVDSDKAYYCFCAKERLDKMREDQMSKKLPPRYDGACATLDPKESAKRVKAGEKAVIRLRVPKSEDVVFEDLIRGKTVVNSRELDDFVIAKSLEEPLYNFTVVIDDHTMEISHVIRGEDHISNTPKQILIYRAFGWPIPEFAHLPLILNEDKSKLSKRKNKVSVDDYLTEGYLPEAILNFLALVGWSSPDGKETLSLDEMVKNFTLDRVHKGGAVFDIRKLEWVNGEYIKKLISEDIDAFYERVKPLVEGKLPAAEEKMIKRMIQDPDFSGRFKKLSEIPEALAPFFQPIPDYSNDLIMLAKFNITPEILKKVLSKAKETLEKEEWKKGDSSKAASLSEKMTGMVAELGLKNGQVLWPIRVALSGLEKSPNFSTLMVYLGKDETLKRLDHALTKVG
jgi:nondiscriminating glutamyl-tRNA synthetase